MSKVIFTKHALERMKLRHVSESNVIRVLEHPSTTKPSTEQKDAVVSIRTINDRTIHVVSKYLPAENKTLVLSAWVRGEEDPTPIIWQILTLPFKFMLWGLKLIFSGSNKRK